MTYANYLFLRQELPMIISLRYWNPSSILLEIKYGTCIH